MTARRATAALACAAALLAAPARAGDDPLDDRRFRVVVALDAVGANGPERPDAAAGARLSLGLRRRRLQVLASVEALAPLGAPAAEPRLGGLVLGGAGIGFAPLADRAFLVHAGFCAGAHRIQLHDYIEGGWMNVSWFAFGPRVGVSYRVGGDARGAPIAAVVGASVTALLTGAHDDPLRHYATGPAALATLTVGAEWSR